MKLNLNHVDKIEATNADILIQSMAKEERRKVKKILLDGQKERRKKEHSYANVKEFFKKNSL